MTKHQRQAEAASVLLVGLAGTEMSPALQELVASGILGVVLFARNVLDPAQVAELVRGLKTAAGRPLLVGVDQEGGTVRRLRHGFSQVPDMRALGACRDPALAHAIGRLLGRELRAVGIDLNLAPVLDVDTNPQNPVIGARALSSDPVWVGTLGVALGRGLEWEGVAACGKHFPGHGDTLVDSHRDLPRLAHERARLESVELSPFRAWVQAGLGAIMTAHILFDALDPDLPATLSKHVISGLLRGQLRYEGPVLSDDLEMRAIFDRQGPGAAAVLAVEAGVDVLLACGPAAAPSSTDHGVLGDIVEALDRARSDRPGFEAHFQVSRARAGAFAARWARPAAAPRLERLATAEAAALLERVAAGARGRA
jgi:beta-N-acetylhexosaminidase